MLGVTADRKRRHDAEEQRQAKSERLVDALATSLTSNDRFQEQHLKLLEGQAAHGKAAEESRAAASKELATMAAAMKEKEA
ncbi:expressed protein [Chlorella variabilis]|uniref:Expressed protein n=1 Tax=Chlorella variabilis TaxID=554065 RepID=E1ZPJ4_CHLVA|nr:expressed protein [Chlorella variabilis]EFN52251.1 expressed protein [Chlorella variabilis]|eukprot:XP_005844353.1 expressed protein [Chlorella variabilis]